MSRSGSPYSTPRDANRVPFLVAASTADGVTPVVLEADPTTHQLQVSSSGGGGGGSDVQYTDGSAAVTHPTGTIPVFNKAGTITAVSDTNPLPISGSVTQSTPSNLKMQAQIFDPGSGNGASITASGALKVDGSAVTQPVSGTVTANAGTGTFNIQSNASINLSQVSGASTATGHGTASGSLRVELPTDGTGVIGLNAGTNTIGDVNLTASARGGYSVSSQTNLTTTATVSGSAGKFGGVMFINLNSAPAYIQIFDTTGAVTLGTTAPTFVIPVPSNATAANGVAAVHEFSVGIAITNGIKVAATTTATGATTVTTGLTGFVMYK